MRIPMIGKRFLIACLLSASFASVACADGFNYGIDAGIGESDNVSLVQTNKVSQTIGIADLDFTSKETGSRLSDDIVGSFTYLDFLQHAYSNEFLGHFDGLVRYALVPERLTWTLQDNWGQLQVNPFGSLVPTNQQNINYLSTGPDWHERLGGTGFLNVSARYSRAQYSVSPYDSNRLLGIVGLGRELSAQSSVSVNGSVERVLFDNTLAAGNTDYDSDNVYLRYELHGARNDLSADIGVTRIDAGTAANSGSKAELQWTRKVSEGAQFILTGGRQMTDASSAFNSVQSGPNTNVVNVNSPASNIPAAVSSGIYTSDYVAAAWKYARHRTTLGLSARWEDDTYINEPQFDGTRGILSANVERRMTRALTAQLFGNLYQSHYTHDQFGATSPNYTDQDGLYGAALTLREGRGLEIRLRYSHMSRDITAGAGTGYQENRIFLTIGYRPQQSGTGRSD